MKFHLVEALEQAQCNGMDREEVAEMLERYADAVREGYTNLPEDRGDWWLEVHKEQSNE
jgi:hypothetical protein